MAETHHFRLRTTKELFTTTDTTTIIAEKILQIIGYASVGSITITAIIIFLSLPKIDFFTGGSSHVSGFLWNIPKESSTHDIYGGWKAVKGESTGRFHIEKINNRFTFVSPVGNSFFLRGINWTQWYGQDPQILSDKYNNSKVLWAREAIRRFRDWGINAIGFTSFTEPDGFLNRRVQKMPYVEIFYQDDEAYQRKFGDPSAFPDLWSEEWKAEMDVLAQLGTSGQSLSDPFFIGWTTSNEPDFAVLTKDRTGLHTNNRWFRAMTEFKAETPGKKTFQSVYESQYTTIDDLNAVYDAPFQSFDDLQNADMTLFAKFEVIDPGEEEDSIRAIDDITMLVTAAAGQYQKVIYEAIKKYDPNVLVGSPKFIGNAYFDPRLLQAVGRYADFMAVNAYGLIPDMAYIESFYWNSGIDPETRKPVIVSEFSIMDEPCNIEVGIAYPGVSDQKARAEAYDGFTNKLIESPVIIGYSWHAYHDFTIQEEFRDPSGCDYFNFGIVDRMDQEYTEMIDRGKEIRTTSFDKLVWEKIFLTPEAPSLSQTKEPEPVAIPIATPDPMKEAILPIPPASENLE